MATPTDFTIDAAGWCAAARQVLSPNCDDRSAGTAVDLLIIHNISLPPGEFGGDKIEALFCNRLDYDAHPYFDQLRALRVSAHFLVRRDGSLLQFVSTDRRAWHAGASAFAGRERCNDFSIGIELEGTDTQPFEAAQYRTLVALSLALQAHHGLTDVMGHQHVAPGRKTDPGPFFDWQAYQNAYRRAHFRRAPTAPADTALRFVVDTPTV